MKCSQRISDSFTSNTGVKQGCNLSPSNLFQNDLHAIFDEECDPVQLGESELNSLSWEDDFIVSRSAAGLQNCLNKLSDYCCKWDLHVNTGKTKVMIMSTGRASQITIKFAEQPLECVNTYKYLGLIISRNGCLKHMQTDRISRAKRASFAIRQALSTSQNVSVNLFLCPFLTNK